MLEIRRQKAKTTRKLAYMDPPEPRRAAELFAAQPQQSAATKVATKPQLFVIPIAKDLPPSDDEVLIDFLWPWLILTVARARLFSGRLVCRRQLILSLRLLQRPQSGAGSSARPKSGL